MSTHAVHSSVSECTVHRLAARPSHILSRPLAGPPRTGVRRTDAIRQRASDDGHRPRSRVATWPFPETCIAAAGAGTLPRLPCHRLGTPTLEAATRAAPADRRQLACGKSPARGAAALRRGGRARARL